MLTPASIAVHATDPARRSAVRTLGAASSHDLGHPRSQRGRGPAGTRRARTAAVTADSGPAVLLATGLNWEDAPGVSSHTQDLLPGRVLVMTPTRGKKTGRPSKGARRKMVLPVGSILQPMVKAQARAEGIEENELLVNLVMEHWPNWSTRGALPEAAAHLLATRRGGHVNLRVPEDTAREIFLEAGDGAATNIVAELIARHLPERVERFRSPNAPQQEELALSS